jgi:hypothetical protein
MTFAAGYHDTFRHSFLIRIAIMGSGIIVVYDRKEKQWSRG